MSLKKQYNKKTPVCKVTFILAKDIVHSANHVSLAGDFNNWDVESIPMKKLKSGEFSVSVNLEKGREYQFKYLIDDGTWLNEKEADKHVPNVFHSENSVVIV
ncbi:MAG: glycoside hydrolase [Bacteroidales bacterium]|jgi:1,4-alpha-glucan branching enzyme|nr:MAG: glycoside hydrolase [Bacteroidales bacterium]